MMLWECELLWWCCMYVRAVGLCVHACMCAACVHACVLLWVCGAEGLCASLLSFVCVCVCHCMLLW